MAKRKYSNIPPYNELIIPTIRALKQLGGSGTIEEINETVYKVANLAEDALKVPHNNEGLTTEVDYRLAWSRTYLKKYGLIENSARGVWALINADINLDKLNHEEIVKTVREQSKEASVKSEQIETINREIEHQIEEAIDWKEELLNTISQITPDAFERLTQLTQRILRESGFVQVEVTGKSGDGGIDGKGIVKINGFLSFHVIFQCKRYKGSVSPSQVRDFRGAMQGRADKGILITTGTFTRDAIKEATRDGAPPIDLIDGELLCEKLKEFKLGISTELIEKVSVNKGWYKQP